MDMTSRYSLFLGAGASSPFDFPTTKTFIDDLRNKLGTSYEGELLTDILNITGYCDAEHVLGLLNALEPISKHPIQDLFTKYPAHISLPTRGGLPLLDVLGSLSRLRGKLIEDIYDQYQFRNAKITEICITYGRLLDALFSLNGSAPLSIFSTNYDRIIERLCYQKDIELIDGFVRNRETKKVV